MREGYIPKLLKYLESLDVDIDYRREILERMHRTLRRGSFDPIYTWGPTAALASFKDAKRRLLELFSELKGHYKGSIEDKLEGE